MAFFNIDQQVFIRLLLHTVDFTNNYFGPAHCHFKTFTTHIFNQDT